MEVGIGLWMGGAVNWCVDLEESFDLSFGISFLKVFSVLSGRKGALDIGTGRRMGLVAWLEVRRFGLLK